MYLTWLQIGGARSIYSWIVKRVSKRLNSRVVSDKRWREVEWWPRRSGGGSWSYRWSSSTWIPLSQEKLRLLWHHRISFEMTSRNQSLYSGKFLIIFFGGEKAPHPWFEKLFFILYRFVCPSIVKQIREEETPLFLSFLTGGCLIHCIDLFSRNGFFCCTWNPPHLLGYYCVLNVLV